MSRMLRLYNIPLIPLWDTMADSSHPDNRLEAVFNWKHWTWEICVINSNEIKYVTYPCLGVGMLFGSDQFIRSRTYSIILAGPSSTFSSQDPSATSTIGWAIPTSLPEVPALSHWRVDLSCASIAGIVNVNQSGARARVDGYLHTTSTKKKHKKHMKSTALDSTWHVNNSLGWYRTV